MLDLIREQGYTLIIDESLSLFESIRLSSGDVRMVMDAGYIQLMQHEKDDDDVYRLVEGTYDGESLNKFFRILQARDVIRIPRKNDKEALFFWLFPAEWFRAFKDVFVLTYQFEGQSMAYFFKLSGLEYSYIGIDHPDEKTYRFSERGLYVPEYVTTLQDKIHILDKPKLNAVGDKKTALSMAWFTSHPELVVKLKNNVYNFFNHIADAPASDRLWCTYKEAKSKLRGRGYASRYTAFNLRATNDYKNCTALAYCANIYMNVAQKRYYEARGLVVDQDLYALSSMVQWVWRSAIRDGKEVTIYIPSKRMRTLFENWIEEVSA